MFAFLPTSGSGLPAGFKAAAPLAPATSPRGAGARARSVVRAQEYEAPVTRRLSDALKERDVEARKAREEEEKREQAALWAAMEKQRKIEAMENIPDSQQVGSVEDFMFKEGVQDVLGQLDNDLVGLLPVKQRVREIAALLVIDKMRTSLGLETAVPSLHMSFTGAPGTGKTTVAMRMGQILQKMGYARSGHLVVATRDDLVGQYVGHTAPKTKAMIKEAFGGVLLVDEAYYLYNAANDRDYGQESIEILLNVMEHQREDLVVVLAGYEDRMNTFYSYIPGMSSRIGNHINFPNYTDQELVDIAHVMTREQDYILDYGCDDVFLNYIRKRMELPFFSNARTVRNAVDRARMRAAIRLFNTAMSGGNGMVTAGELALILPEDLVSAEELAARGDEAIFE